MSATHLSLTICLIILATTLESASQPIKEDAKKALEDKKANLLQKLQNKLGDKDNRKAELLDRLNKKKPTTNTIPAVASPTVEKPQKKPVQAPQKTQPQGYHKPHGGCGPKKHRQGGHHHKSRGHRSGVRSVQRSSSRSCKRMKKGSAKHGSGQRQLQHHPEHYGAVQQIHQDHHY